MGRQAFTHRGGMGICGARRTGPSKIILGGRPPGKRQTGRKLVARPLSRSGFGGRRFYGSRARRELSAKRLRAHEMSENVWEGCPDCFADDYYEHASKYDP